MHKLHHFDNAGAEYDFKSIGLNGTFARPNNGSFKSPYNGNIGAMTVNNGGLKKGNPSTTNSLPLFYNYSYDQLNRIVGMQNHGAKSPYGHYSSFECANLVNKFYRMRSKVIIVVLMISCTVLAWSILGMVTHRPGSWNIAKGGLILSGFSLLAGVAHLILPEKR